MHLSGAARRRHAAWIEVIARLAQHPDEADLGYDHRRDSEGHQQPSPSCSRGKRERAMDDVRIDSRRPRQGAHGVPP
jgi:hypothetical protein